MFILYIADKDMVWVNVRAGEDKTRLQLKQIYIYSDAYKHNNRIIEIINLIAKIKENN